MINFAVKLFTLVLLGAIAVIIVCFAVLAVLWTVSWFHVFAR